MLRALTLFLLFAVPIFSQTPKPPVLMISVDGMRPDYVTQAEVHALKLPVLRSFIERGTYADGVVGILPTITHPSHTTLVTGVWPAEHGIYNNVRFDPLRKNKEEWYWYAPEIKAQTIWQAASAAGITTASVQWPVTVDAAGIDFLIPAYPVHGADDRYLLEAMARPDGYLQQLEKSVGPFYIVQPVAAFDELLTRTSIALIRDKHPGLMTLHLVSLDSVEHATGPFSAQSNAALEAIDGMIGRLIAAERAVNPNAIVVVVSDHGFAPVHTRVNLLVPFVAAGLISLAPAKTGEAPAIATWKATLWNADGSAYVMLKDASDVQTRGEVAALLERLEKDPANGIARVMSQKEIIAGGGDPAAAFMVAMKPGYTLGEALEGNMTVATAATGTHGYTPDFPEMLSAFFEMVGGIAAHHDVGVIDMRQIAPTIVGFLGVRLKDAKEPAIQCFR